MSRAFTPPDTLSQDDIRTVADVRRAVWINGLFGLGAGSVSGMVGHLVLQSLQRRYVGDDNVAAAAPTTKKSPTTAAGKAAEKAAAATTTRNTKSLLYKLLRPLPPLGKNTFFLSFLGGGALGSFILSSTAGKNAVHLLHPIFNVGRDEYAGKSPYQIEISKAEKEEQNHEQQQDGKDSLLAAAIDKKDELDIQHHKQRTLQRKLSMKRRLESGNSLSDTHSTTAHYNITSPEEEEETSIQFQKDKAMHRAEVWEKRQTNRRQWVKNKIESGGSLSGSHVQYYSSENNNNNNNNNNTTKRG